MYTALRSLGLLAIGALSALGALSLAHVGPAQAQSHTVTLAALDARVQADEAKINLQSRRIGILQVQNAALRRKTAPLSLSGHDLTITGVNVHIVSGSGSTSDGTTVPDDPNDTPVPGKRLTGLGNLIIGYNRPRSGKGVQNITVGSHNLVLGDRNNYSSFGGLVAGEGNTISGLYASVTGGDTNTASGNSSSISGGSSSTASGVDASVSGGFQNSAINNLTSITGGEYNKATGFDASVSGGGANTASSPYASISGGNNNTAGGLYSSISGGDSNRTSSTAISVSGGKGVTVTDAYGWAAGSPSSKAYSGSFRSP